MSSPAQTSQPAVESGLGPYDALLLVSFGGPEGPEEVMPFLRQVTGGRGIPEERLTEVAQHYLAFGGRSPINDQNRAMIAALEKELEGRLIDLPALTLKVGEAPVGTPGRADVQAQGAANPWRWLLWLNPMTGPILGYQSALLQGAWPAWPVWVALAAWTGLLAALLSLALARSRDQLVDWL